MIRDMNRAEGLLLLADHALMEARQFRGAREVYVMTGNVAGADYAARRSAMCEAQAREFKATAASLQREAYADVSCQDAEDPMTRHYGFTDDRRRTA